MKRLFLLIGMTLYLPSLSALSLMLLNDSPYKLDVVVVNALGDVIGQVTLDTRAQVTWYATSKGYSAPNSPTVPLTVIWYCQDGNEYGIWAQATPGSMVTAQLSSGQKMCKFVRKNADGKGTTTTSD